MKILVYSHVPLWEQHHSEAIEICNKHLSNKDDVFMLNCNKALFSCPANIYKKKNLCKKCLNQTNKTLNNLLENKVKTINLVLTEKKRFIINNLNNLNDFINFEYENVPFGRIALTTLITDKLKTSFFNFSDIKKSNGIEMLESSVGLYEESKKIIRENNIEKVYVWNGRRSCDGPINYAAKKLGREYFSFISGGKKGKYQCQPTISAMELNYCKNLSKNFYIEYKNKNNLQIFEEEALKHFNFLQYGSLEGKSYGLVQFSKNFDKKTNFTKKNSKRNIAIFPGSNWEYVALGKDFTTINGNEFNQYDFLELILNNSYINQNFNLYIRWHPFLKQAGKSEKNHIEKIIDKYENVTFYMPASKVNSYELIKFSDVVITFGSTIGLEATMYKKPSILFGKCYWEDNDAAYKPNNISELENLLRDKNLEPKPFINALKEGFFQRNRGKEDFKYVSVDKHHRYFFKGKRIKNLTLLDKVRENIKVFMLNNDILSKLYYKYFEKISKKIF